MAFDMSKAAFGKASVSNLDKIQHIKLAMIDRNEGNFYSIEGIEELADSIRTVGLMDPVRVVSIEGGKGQRYKLISGHRRLEAYWHLLRECAAGNWETIPALIMEDMDDLTETFALITANSTARELTYAEKLKQEQLLRETLTAMKEAGKPVPKNLGQYIADQIGTSRNEVSRMHSINENLIPEAREQVDKGEMTAQKAYELSRKPEREQRETVGAAKSQQTSTQPMVSRTQWQGVEDLLEELLARVRPSIIASRSDGIAQLKAELKRRGSFGHPGMTGAWLTAVESTLGITYGNGLEYITPSALYDTVCIAAMRRCAKLSKLDTEEDKPSPAAELWHAPDDPPRQDGSYVCMYRGAGDDGATRRTTVMEYREGAWRMYGNSVEGVYTVLKWTEVPEC